MAGDIIDGRIEGSPSPKLIGSEKKPASTDKTYETFNTPPPSANSLPEGSGQNTAGAIGRHEVPGLSEALSTVRLQDFKQVHMYPCVKDSLLLGIGGAFGMGGIRAIFGAPIPKAANWAVGTFVITAISYHEFCQARRTMEKTQIKKIVEVMDIKKAEKEAALEAKRQERRKLKEEENARQSAQTWKWKFW
ncbi:hypothetical protein BGHDH14_bgh04672 [Blumeria hordei DH14]|uniref:Cytochrome c oxidase assembly protein COX20, mitochondrial n=1 Tax=Blumeria graminis f. sp. hordei (strain DH14) TaxID=546991 RepID=N1J9Y9_BLUG1|nr:hypothetical protein BGHDH14_bgh04672 [Blumeria hordei DH14]